MDSEHALPVLDAIERIQSSGLKERQLGLNDLKRLLEIHKKSSYFDRLEDKTVHLIYEALFRSASLDRPSYAKADKPNVRTSAAQRLVLCASVLRLAVDVTVKIIRARTLKALIDHISQALLAPGDGFCEPLASDYLKALKVALAYSPHVEHLARTDWMSITEFCLGSIQVLEADMAIETNSLSFRVSASQNVNGTGNSTQNSMLRGSDRRYKDKGENRNWVSTLLDCVRFLVSASNCPILDKKEELLSTVIEFLQIRSSAGDAHVIAFGIINKVLVKTTVESASVTNRTLEELLPIMKAMWTISKQPLRNEMVITLIQCKANLASLLNTERGAKIVSDVEKLLEAMTKDYSKYLDKVPLDMEDLDFGKSTRIPCNSRPMVTPCFVLRESTQAAEYNWAIVYLMAYMSSWVDFEIAQLRKERANHDAEAVGLKRPRNTVQIEELVRRISRDSFSSRVCALQVLSFVVQQRALSIETLIDLVESLLVQVSNENSLVASWAMVTIAACTFQLLAATPEPEHSTLRALWATAWQLASRLVTSVSHCRAACNLLCRLAEHDLINSDLVTKTADQILTSPALNGPALLSDSTLAFWSIILGECHLQKPVNKTNSAANHLLTWLFSKWNPSSFDKSAARQFTHTTTISDIVNCIGMSIGRRWLPHSPVNFICLGSIGQAWLRCIQDRNLTRYLLLLDDKNRLGFSPDEAEFRTASTSANKFALLPVLKAEATALTLCLEELERAINWLTDRTHPITQINPDVTYVLAALCITSEMLSSATFDNHNQKALEVSASSATLASEIFSNACKDDTEPASFAALLHAVAPFLPANIINDDAFVIQETIPDFISRIANATLAHKFVLGNNDVGTETDVMDLDGELESQNSRNVRTNIGIAPQGIFEAQCSLEFYHSSIAAYVTLMSSLRNAANTEGLVQSIPSSFFQYLFDMTPLEFLSCSQLLNMLASSELGIAIEDAEMMLRHVGENFLAVFEYERCEVSTVMCLGLMKGLAPLWVDESMESLREAGDDIYLFIIGILFGKGISSPSVQIGIANLLYELLDIQPEFSPRSSDSSISVRTSLFQVLQYGELRVKYHVAQNISRIFGYFVLNQHDLIFDDVQNSLPRDISSPEGMAIRLLVFSQLASAWSSLLRRCVYHIFETAGLVVDTTAYASNCAKKIAEALDLSSARHLFQLFRSQILYTWLESQPLNSIPYAAFGFVSLAELLRDSRDEIVSQLLMRGSDEKLNEVGDILQTAPPALLNLSFSRVAACGIAKDLSTPPTDSQNTQPRQVETRIKDVLGNEQWQLNIQTNFEQIIGHFFLRLQEESQFDKVSTKWTHLSNVSQALRTMRNISWSELPMPAGQQPLFRSKFLIPQIDRLCKQISTKVDIKDIWNPFLVTSVARMLFDDIHPALGVMHARRTVQRIRILVALSGDVAATNYPLQMLIHGLRPFVTNKYCAEDAIGVIEYLFTKGKQFLTSNPSFLAGTAISIFISLRDFYKTSQDSITQESQHLATISRAKKFHRWFSEYLDHFEPKFLSELPNKAFRSLINTAKSVTNSGAAAKETVEGTLLWQLLLELKSSRINICPSFFDLFFKLLCKDFSLPESFHNDILGSGEKAASFVVELWRTCEKQFHSRNYRIWVAKTMGRSFMFNGAVPRKISRENTLNLGKWHEMQSNEFLDSRLAIFRHLVDKLFSEIPSEVGLVEKTLRLILSCIHENENEILIKKCLPSIMEASFVTKATVALTDPNSDIPPVGKWSELLHPDSKMPYSEWVRDLAIATCKLLQDDPIVGSITGVLRTVEGVAEQLYPYIFHSLVEAAATRSDYPSQTHLAEVVRHWFQRTSHSLVPNIRLMVNALLYLRSQPSPSQVTKADRNWWLDVDYETIAHSAKACNMLKSALLFVELSQESRTAQAQDHTDFQKPIPYDLLLSIFEEIDEPDSYYGVPRKPMLSSIADRLEFEGSGVQGLLFRGAQLDGLYRSGQNIQTKSLNAIVKAATVANLNGLTAQLFASQQTHSSRSELTDLMLRASQRLCQWDILVPSTNRTDAETVYTAFQSIVIAKDRQSIRYILEDSLLEVFDRLRQVPTTRNVMRSSLRALAALTEIDDAVGSHGNLEISEALSKLTQREAWMERGHFEDVSPILLCRETFTSILNQSLNLRTALQLTPEEARLIDVRTNLQSSSLYREHGAIQESLAAVTYLSSVVKSCLDVGIQIDAAVRDETASVLWRRGELIPSINMLQELSRDLESSRQSIDIGRSRLLARLGHRVSEARLESSEEIQKKYLTPALEYLADAVKGDEAGHVFHHYASYCHQQLRNPEIMAEISRIEKLKTQKQTEIRLLSEELAAEKRSKATSSKQKNAAAARALQDAKKWLEIDLVEIQRLRESREAYLAASLDYYLKSLAASDSHDDDAPRFFAIWLEFHDDPAANQSAENYLNGVASHKFAHLMNQLVSRLEEKDSQFQISLRNLVYRICVNHPYHGMYQVCSASNANSQENHARNSRTSAALNVANQLKSNPNTSELWNRIKQAHLLCLRLSEWSAKNEYKVNEKIVMNKVTEARRVERDLPKLALPPVTLSINLRADCDYAEVPVVERYEREMRVMNGNSAPKLANLMASDGVVHKQLFKSNDDLRQDAIMEQVFNEVNTMLKRNTATRQRDLRIRTYNVVPLSSTAGVIEFVQQTIAIHEFLVPAHQSYHPKDLKFTSARNKILEAEKLSLQQRLKAYKDVASRYHPVMRHFFFERFLDPDDWFERRLAYTRSNATISILGHALGLGDRHCHNILLDQRTGEVVHIDLGIAFEAGRVLKIPEVVPFRLTRDIVDGFGIMKTEGIFRRCCGFTLEALRQERDSIMTLLNVLRYDPLYRWTLSPIRAKRVQEAQDRDTGEPTKALAAASQTLMSKMSSKTGHAATERETKKAEGVENVHEGGEAERALTVVERKLSHGLSIEAAVNELIQQATDEKNLALLFCGWAAFS